MIAAPGVVQSDADLEDALVEQPDRAPLGVPLVLDLLMRLVVLAGVEKRDPGPDAFR